MDDGRSGGDVEVLMEAFQMIIEEGKKLKLFMNGAKCEIIADDDGVVTEGNSNYARH